MSVIEIVSYNAPEEILADLTLGDPALQYVKKSEGCLSVHQGFQLEDKTRAYMIITWESYEHYQKTTQREDYPSFIAWLKENHATGLLMQHIQFDANTTNAFGAPVTEIATFKPKEGHTQAELDAVIAEFTKNIYLAKGAHPPIAWGAIKQTPELYMLIIGWDSVEAHMASSKAAPFAALAEKLVEISDLEFKHAALKTA